MYTYCYRGFNRVCNNQAMELFQYEELELLICGNPILDLNELKAGTSYDDGFTADSRVIQDFWHVVMELTEEETKLFLKFISGR